jgi:hypothetical protein
MFVKIRIYSGALGALLICSTAGLAQKANCVMYNYTAPTVTIPSTMSDGQQHTMTGQHGYLGQINGTCTYTGGASAACAVSCNSVLSQNGAYENSSTLSSISLHHSAAGNQAEGGAQGSPGASVTCGSTVGVLVNTCPSTTSCNASIGISGSIGGLSASFSYSPTYLLFQNSWSNPLTCAAHTTPACEISAMPGDPGGQDGSWSYDTTTCEWVWKPFATHTPVVIDTDGSGFHLTSAENGVLFNFSGTGKKIQIAWTAAGSTNGWLALDRNHNGLIDNATELFGNATAQPSSPYPNGFLALAVFDTPAQGGNGDGVINNQDTIWPQLVVWIDSNHDGISQPGELHSLDSIGIHSISLAYTEAPYTDAYGNQFRYKGSLIPDSGDKVDRVVYDVILGTNQ